MPNEKKTWLEKLKVGEISLVDAGANRGAVSVLMKRATEAGEDAKKLFKKLFDVMGVNPESIDKLFQEDAVDIEKKLQEMASEVEALKKAKTLSDAVGKFSIELSKAETKKSLMSIKEEVSKLDQNDPTVSVLKEMVVEALAKEAAREEFAKGLSEEEQTKFNAMVFKEKDAYMAKDKKKPAEGSAEEESGESKDEEDAEMEKRLKEVNKANSELREKVEKMEKFNVIAKIKSTDLKDVADVAKADNLAEAIYKLRKSDGDSTDVLVATLKAMAAQLKKAKLFDEIGKNGASAETAEAKLESMAKARQTKDGISYAKAYALILDENPDLYTQSREESKK